MLLIIIYDFRSDIYSCCCFFVHSLDWMSLFKLLAKKWFKTYWKFLYHFIYGNACENYIKLKINNLRFNRVHLKSNVLQIFPFFFYLHLNFVRQWKYLIIFWRFMVRYALNILCSYIILSNVLLATDVVN